MFGVVKGVGGNVTVLQGTSAFVPTGTAVFDVRSWQISTQAIPYDLSNVSAVGSRSGTKGREVAWSCDLPLNEFQPPETALSLAAGCPTAVWFKLGEQSLWHRVTNTMVLGTSTVTNSTGGVVRATLQGRGGDVTYYSAVPPSVGSFVAPVASFVGTPTSGVGPLSVDFADTSTGAPTGWFWEKNDGVFGWLLFSGNPIAESPTEVFTTGTYDIRLTVTNATGSHTVTQVGYIVVT